MKKTIALLLAVLTAMSLAVTAYAGSPVGSTSVDLDVEENDKCTSSCGIDQKFSVEVEKHYIDVSKVKVEWTISEIDVGYQSYKTWNTTTLEWDEVKSSAEITSTVAEFKLTNYSSIVVEGTLDFTPVEDEKIAATYSGAIYTNNSAQIGSMVKLDYSVDADLKASAPSTTIKAALEFNKDKFLDIDDVSSVSYGTYTITISEVKKPD